jgi:hypothetical protein
MLTWIFSPLYQTPPQSHTAPPDQPGQTVQQPCGEAKRLAPLRQVLIQTPRTQQQDSA